MTWFLNKSPTLFERLSEEKKRLEIHWVKLDRAWCETSFQESFVNSIPLRTSMSGFHRLGLRRPV